MRCATLALLPVKKLSRQRPSSPFASRRWQRGEPKNPAPPVTRIRFICKCSSSDVPDGEAACRLCDAWLTHEDRTSQGPAERERLRPLGIGSRRSPGGAVDRRGVVGGGWHRG